MRIVVIAPDAYPVSPKTGGSVEISIYEIAKRISQTHQVTIISRRSNGLPTIYKKGNLTIIRIQSGVGYLARAIQYMKKHKFDCIQVENRPRYIPSLRLHFSKKPIILALHSLTFMRYLTQKAQLMVLQMADTIVCNSNYIQAYYQKMFPEYADKICAIHLGVDVARFSIPDYLLQLEPEKLYQIERPYTILYVGRVIPKKGVHILIQAAGILKKVHPSIRLLIVGNCNNKRYQERLLQEAEKAGVPVHLLGPIQPSFIHYVYRLGDCLVCPTQFEEAFGLVNIEAMASGVPVIASRRGGIPEIIDESNGILVDQYDDPTAFATAIEKLIKSPFLAQSLAVNGYQTVVDKFSWQLVANRYDELFKSHKMKKTVFAL